MTRHSRSATPLLVAITLSIAAAGCLYSRDIANTRKTIEEEFPGSRFDRRIVLSIGSRTLRAAGWLTSLMPDEDVAELRPYLDDVKRIKVGVFETEELPDDRSAGVPMLSQMIERGWEVAVRVRDEQDRVWLMYRTSRNRVRALYVIVLNEDSLVIARVEGHLDRILRRAVEDYRPFARLAHR